MEIRNAGVLVTGASRGLGLELSRALARAGAKVVMVARLGRPEPGREASSGARALDIHGTS